MVALRLRVVVAAIADAVVGDQHNQQVVPCLALLQSGYKLADTSVQVVEGVEHLVVQMFGGHIPWFVTAQCGIADEKWFVVCLHDVFGQRLKGHLVVHTPFGRPLCGVSKVVHAHEMLKPCGHQIAAHVGKVDVSAIQIARFVAHLLQR